jgi:hypothetical protein
MVMLAMKNPCPLLGGILGHCVIYTHPKVQPARLYCSLATWRMLGWSDGNSGSCMARFMCPNRA